MKRLLITLAVACLSTSAIAECKYFSDDRSATLSGQAVGELPDFVELDGSKTCAIDQKLDAYTAQCDEGVFQFEYILSYDKALVDAFTLDGERFVRRCSYGPVISFNSVFDGFSKTAPAYDLDHAKRKEPATHDMALGLYLLAVSKMGMVEEIDLAAKQLLEVRFRGGEGKPGWGLGFAYDAFGDKTINPAETVYGITTAIAVRGLFDAFDVTGRVEYRDAALAALDYFHSAAFVASGDEGFFWYSDQEADFTQGITINVSAMLMGQYARAYKYTGNAAYEDVAVRSFRYLWGHRQEDPHGVKWPYRYVKGEAVSVNDALHAAYIVQGFVDLAKYLPQAEDFTPAVDYLDWFAGTMKTSERERLWGAGMMILTLAEAGRTDTANMVVREVVPRFALAEGRFRYETRRTDVFVRHTAHLLAGLAALETEPAQLSR